MKKTKLTAEQWKKIALKLFWRCDWAIANLRPPPGSGLLFNTKTGKTRPWREPFIEAMEMIPGVKIDREAVQACQLPRKERNKWFEKNRPEQHCERVGAIKPIKAKS